MKFSESLSALGLRVLIGCSRFVSGDVGGAYATVETNVSTYRDLERRLRRAIGSVRGSTPQLLTSR